MASNSAVQTYSCHKLTLMYLKAGLAAAAFVLLSVAVSMRCILRPAYRLLTVYPILWAISVAAAIVIEACFLAVWLRKKKQLEQQPYLHRPRCKHFHPRDAFNKFVDEQHNLSKWICIKEMLSEWFGGVPADSIKRGNIAELLTYGFWYMSREEYEQTFSSDPDDLVEEIEKAWPGVVFPPGYDPNLGFMAHLWQPIRCAYRCLGFYIGIEVIFLFKHCIMLAMGFKSKRYNGYRYYTYIPDTPASTEAEGTDSRRDPRKQPILFQHGVGIGLLPYSLLVSKLAAAGHPVVCIECDHLAMRWVKRVPDADEVVDVMAAVLNKLCAQHGWTAVCAAGHSYGTFFCSRLLQLHPHLVDSMTLIDPVTMNMFTGHLIKTFVYQPHSSSLITWLIARDIHHAASVCRNFFWSQLNMWPDQLPAKSLIVLSDGDDLVPVQRTVEMLRHEAPHAVVMHHPTHRHADFLKDLPWQQKVVSAMMQVMNSQHPPHMPDTVGLMQAFRTRVRNHSKTRLTNTTSDVVRSTPSAGQPCVSSLYQATSQQKSQSVFSVDGIGVLQTLCGDDQERATFVTAAGTTSTGVSAGAAQRGSSPDDVTSPVSVVHAQQEETYFVQDVSDSGLRGPRSAAVRRRKTVAVGAQDQLLDVGSKVDVAGKQQLSTQQHTQQHGHSDSASSLDSFVSRLRPKPHRMTTQQ